MTHAERALLVSLLVAYVVGLAALIGADNRNAMVTCQREYSRAVCERTLNP